MTWRSSSAQTCLRVWGGGAVHAAQRKLPIDESEAQYLSKRRPVGDVKQSGIARKGSRHGLEEYLEMKYLCMRPQVSTHYMQTT
ncbi:MAG: hypothetical protein E5Y88_33485 [Mesorhizobium sp.]|nr:MAG: hypothetical protein E5Y88_33485 [Mesorhizobium sp.]TIQ35550.1 MAG: hypothetical protein E5X49_33535 [Mesorhizobium sp.]TIW59546.1 MAG: hypothetical protein E5V48_17425 [Mesorhizobium sp.]TJW31121.1 MAG: hypothetical protein E5V49_17835 [Mesorhizobium sp.]